MPQSLLKSFPDWLKNQKKWLFGLAILPVAFFIGSNDSNASQVVREWFFGNWNCNIDGRRAQMQWYVVDDPQTNCHNGVCSTAATVRVVGRFSDNGSAWVRLAKQSSNSSQLRIRYLGNEPNNWYLKYNNRTQIADGWTTWRGNRYPLQCRKR